MKLEAPHHQKRSEDKLKVRREEGGRARDAGKVDRMRSAVMVRRKSYKKTSACSNLYMDVAQEALVSDMKRAMDWIFRQISNGTDTLNDVPDCIGSDAENVEGKRVEALEEQKSASNLNTGQR